MNLITFDDQTLTFALFLNALIDEDQIHNEMKQKYFEKIVKKIMNK